MLLIAMQLVVQHAIACRHGIGYSMLLFIIKHTDCIGVNDGMFLTLCIALFQL